MLHANHQIQIQPEKGDAQKKAKNLRKGDNPKTDNFQKKNNILDATKNKSAKKREKNTWKKNTETTVNVA